MKFLLLALILSLVYGAYSQLTSEQVDGDWRSLYMGGDNVDEINEDGLLRAYYRHIECSESCEKIVITFYVKFDEKCTLITTMGQRTKHGSYSIYSEEVGDNILHLIPVTAKMMVIYSVHVDQENSTTKTITLTGEKPTISAEQLQKFYEIAEKHGIPKGNIQYAVPTDTCPP